MLAIQAQKFAASLATIPGLPMMHFNARGVLVLSPPSTATVRAKNAHEEERRVAGAGLLDGVVDGANVVGGGSSGGQGGVVEGTAARRKKAKQPNPLSVKKRKVEVGAKRAREEEVTGESSEDEVEAPSAPAEDGRKKKKRRRGKGGKGEVASAIAEIKAGGLGGVITEMAEDVGECAESGGESGDESD